MSSVRSAGTAGSIRKMYSAANAALWKMQHDSSAAKQMRAPRNPDRWFCIGPAPVKTRPVLARIVGEGETQRKTGYPSGKALQHRYFAQAGGVRQQWRAAGSIG